MAGEEELQKMLREAGKNLGHRIFWNRQLVWKPGMIDQVKTNYKAGKLLLTTARGKTVASNKPAKSGSKPASSDKGFLGRFGKSKTDKAPPAWNALKPLNDGTTELVPMNEPLPSMFSNGSQAVLRMGTVTDAVGLIKEGAMAGGDLFFNREALGPSFKAAGALDGGPMIETAIHEFSDMLLKSNLIGQASAEVGREVAQEVASCLPIIGAALTLSEAFVQTIHLILDKYRLGTLNSNTCYITPGQPGAALAAAKTLYARHATEMERRMAINYTAGGASVAGLFVDFGALSGPVAGILKCAANMAITIANTCLTLREMQTGNRIIREGGPFDITLLEQCPILGTYLLTEAESSALYAFLVGDAPLTRNWQDEVMRIKPKIGEVIRTVNVLQLRSPFELASYDEKGDRVHTFAKGDHFLDTRIHKTGQRAMHQAGLVIRGNQHQENDRNLVGSANFLKNHIGGKIDSRLPWKKKP